MKLEEIINLLREEYGVPEIGDRGDPIESLIQVILSQNTNDTNRDRAYRNLRKRFDSPQEIMEADIEDVAEVISVAGLHNLKAERIVKSLRKIRDERNELSLDFLQGMDVEEAKNWLKDLPGVGPKSAAIVLNFSFNKAAFPVDTHVFRVTKRLGLIDEKETRESAHDALEKIVPDPRMQEFHINLIRHGRRICKARKPLCEKCPLSVLCKYYQQKRQ
ncbi:MAG: endonuclease III domain-containing protein [Candidatus Aenigmatarchaeota archaeon]